MLTIRQVTGDGAHRIGATDLAADQHADGFVWVDISAATPEEAALLDRLGLPDLVVEDMRDDRHLPKLELAGDTLSLTVHGLDVRTLEDELSTVELDCALREKLLVTYHDGALTSVPAVGDRLDEGAIGFERPLLLLHRLLDVMNDVMIPFVDHLDRRLDVIEGDILDEPTEHTRHDLYRLQRDVIQLRRVVLPQAEVVRRLARERPPGWQSGDESLIRDLQDHLDHMVAMCDSYHQLLESAMDSYRSALDDRLNSMLNTLTIVSVLLLPTSVLAGLWGMNFVMVPGAEDPHGFWWLLAGGGAIMVLMLLWFARKGWIGGGAQRRAASRRSTLTEVLEIPVLGLVLKVPVGGSRAAGRVGRLAGGVARRAVQRN